MTPTEILLALIVLWLVALVVIGLKLTFKFDSIAADAGRVAIAVSELQHVARSLDEQADAQSGCLATLIELYTARSEERYLHHIRLSSEEVAAATKAIAATVEVVASAPGPSLAGRTVVVHTRDGHSIQGVVIGDYADRVDLDQAQWLSSKGNTAAGGINGIERINIRSTQVIDGISADVAAKAAAPKPIAAAE